MIRLLLRGPLRRLVAGECCKASLVGDNRKQLRSCTSILLWPFDYIRLFRPLVSKYKPQEILAVLSAWLHITRFYRCLCRHMWNIELISAPRLPGWNMRSERIFQSIDYQYRYTLIVAHESIRQLVSNGFGILIVWHNPLIPLNGQPWKIAIQLLKNNKMWFILSR